MANKKWIANAGGVWNADANWSMGAPLAADTVTIAGSTSTTQLITGSGTVAGATLLGNTALGATALGGTFNFGNTTLGASGNAAALTVRPGTVLTATAAVIDDGMLSVGGVGSRLAVAGYLTLGVARSSYDEAFNLNTLAATGGAAIQAGSLALVSGALVTDVVTIDAASTLELGTAGTATAGQFVIDAGHTLTGAGSVTALGGFINQGTVLAQGGTLALVGAIAGAGSLQIGAGGTLDLSGAASDAQGVTFAAAGSTLVVGPSRAKGVSTLLNQQGTISGFTLGDTIAYAAPAGAPALTALSWQPGASGIGTLTLLGGTVVLGSLSLAGNFAGTGFVVTPGAAAGVGDIVLVAAATPASATPSAGTSTRDVYAWTASASDGWSDASAWRDLSTGKPAAIAPGSNDLVTLGGPAAGAYQVVSGTGNAATLTLLGNTTLKGVFGVGSLAVGTSSGAGALFVTAGSVVSAMTAGLMDGPALVSGAGATLRVSGALTLGAAPSPFDYGFVTNTLTVSAAGTVQADSLVLQAGPLLTEAVSVDATSVLEIGEAGGAASGAAAGTLTIDAGRLVVGAGSIKTASGIINQGTILAQGGTLRLVGTILGSGQADVGAGGTLDLSAAASVDTEALAFTGTNGTLLIGAALSTTTVNGVVMPALTQQGSIAGFLANDTIAYTGTGAPLTDASWQSSGNGAGILTLHSGGATLGTLTLLGDYAHDAFQVTPGASPYVYDITLVAPGSTVASAGTASADRFAWTGAATGAWGDAANWTDLSTGAAAALAPGLNDVVSLGATAPLTLGGMGNAAGLVIAGSSTVTGAVHAASLTVGTDSAPATLTLTSAGVLAATTATVAAGQVQVTGNGARLSVAGTLALGDAGPVAGLTLAGGGTVQAGALALAAGSAAVDATSTLEVGTAGNGAAGRLTVDAGAVLNGTGSIAAAGGIVDRGTIRAEGALAVGSAVSGNGTLEIGLGATLTLGSGTASTTGVQFGSVVGGGHNTGTLALRSIGPAQLNEQGLVSGFLLGDTIAYTGAALTGTTWQAAGDGTGTLTLLSAAGVVGTLTLAGNFDGYGFKVAAGAAPGTSTVSLTITDPLFDAAYYLQQNPDVAAGGVDPYWHYLNVGWKEGRNPDAYFDTKYYLASNPDLAAAFNQPYAQSAGLNPMTQYEQLGWTEGRQPSLLFSGSAYLAAAPDVKAAGANPLVHYLEIGRSEGRATGMPGFDGNLNSVDPFVNAAVYDAQLGATLVPPGAAGQAQASEMYHGAAGDAAGWKAGLNPDAWFDTNYYLTQNPDVKAAGIDPLTHFETQGWLEGRDPSLAFSVSKYLAAAPDVKAGGMDPLLHYIIIGQSEGRAAFLSGPVATVADPLVDAAYYDKQLGATIVPGGTAGAEQAAGNYAASGWQKGLNPDAWFDTKYYLSHNPDIAAAHVDPLLHFETQGWTEGRNPSAQFSTTKYLAAYADVASARVDPLLDFLTTGQAAGRQAFAV